MIGAVGMENDLVEMIKRQTNVLFYNIQITFDEVRDILIIPEFSDMPIEKHVYHMLHSLDQWFINPYIFEEPDFHIDELNSLSVYSDKVLTKEELQNYFYLIKNKIITFLDDLKDGELKVIPENCNFSRLELILGQYRHLSYHIGLIHCFIRCESGKWPTFMGLSQSMDLDNSKVNIP